MRQCELADGVEEIGLVFVLVCSLAKISAAMTLIDVSIMTSSDHVSTKVQCIIKKSLEFYLSITQYVGVGRATSAVFLQKVLKYPVPVFC